MPFDPTPISRPAVSRNGVRVGDLRELATALRAPMPERFLWDFTYVHRPHKCGTVGCALGLAREMGLLDPREELITNAFGLQYNEVARVFGNPGHYGAETHNEVRPEQVADALDLIIVREEAVDSA